MGFGGCVADCGAFHTQAFNPSAGSHGLGVGRTFKRQFGPVHHGRSDQINHAQHLCYQGPGIRQTFYAAANIVLIQAGIPFERVPIPPPESDSALARGSGLS